MNIITLSLPRKRTISVAIWIVFFIPVMVFSQSGKYAVLDTLVPRLMEKAGIPGLALSVLNDGYVVSEKLFGLRSNIGFQAVDGLTVFEAASLTKPVFAYAVMKLVDEGKLDLDIPLESYWNYPDIQSEASKEQITARHVLTHSTGYRNWRRPRDTTHLIFYFAPGERFSYSGEGFVHLSRVVEHITGLPLHEWIRQSVFEPLEMSHSTMIWDQGLGQNSATPHDRKGVPADKFHPTEANAAASLHTTAGDYARFLAALLAGEGLSKASHDMILSSQQNVDPNCSQCSEPNSDPGFRDVSWGLGVGMEHTGKGDYIWHWGDNGNFKAYFCVSLATGDGIVYFANSHGGLSIRDQLVEAVLPGDHPSHRWVKYEQKKL